MEEISFDPRSWGRTAPPGEKPAGKPRAQAGETAPGEAKAGALPEAWRSVAQELDAAPDGDSSPLPAGKAGGRRRAALSLAMAAPALIAAIAWFQYAGPPDTPSPAAAVGGVQAAKTQADARQAAVTQALVTPAAVERSLNLAGAGELARALAALGISRSDADAATAAATPLLGRSGGLRARMAMEQRGGALALQRLQLSYADGSGVVVGRDEAGRFSGRAVAADLIKQVKVLNGELDSESFYTSAVSAGLMNALIPEFINAFAYDFNLAAEVSPGDTFEVGYEQAVNDSGEPVGPPQLLFASLTTTTKSLALYRYVGADGKAGWFDGNGASTRRGLMRTPVDGARISSRFGMRFHPVLHYNRLHGGTDFAAPTGTPIYAAADGVVEFAALKGANGNLTVIRHDNGWRTLYLHQSRFAPGIAPGVRVIQGQHIGDIGTTGRSTGPHLHYEVHIDGERVDPLSIRTSDGERRRIEGPSRIAFLRERDRVDVARAQALF